MSFSIGEYVVCINPLGKLLRWTQCLTEGSVYIIEGVKTDPDGDGFVSIRDDNGDVRWVLANRFLLKRGSQSVDEAAEEYMEIMSYADIL